MFEGVISESDRLGGGATGVFEGIPPPSPRKLSTVLNMPELVGSGSGNCGARSDVGSTGSTSETAGTVGSTDSTFDTTGTAFDITGSTSEISGNVGSTDNTSGIAGNVGSTDSTSGIEGAEMLGKGADKLGTATLPTSARLRRLSTTLAEMAGSSWLITDGMSRPTLTGGVATELNRSPTLTSNTDRKAGGVS
jgi:hypothetical protein